MKRILIWITGATGIVLALLFLNQAYGIQEDTLYNESILEGKNTLKEPNGAFVTREDAIQEAYHVFGQGLNISLMDSDLSMHMNLYCDREGPNTYQWVMSWQREVVLDTYSCTINALTGEVLTVYVLKGNHEEVKRNNQTWTKDTIMKKVTPFLDVIGIDSSEYEIQLEENTPELMGDSYQSCIFINKRQKKQEFRMEINEETREIASFERI